MELSTARLTLREARVDDAVPMAAYQSDPRYLEHYAERSDASQIIAQLRAWAAAEPRENFQFIVTLRSEIDAAHPVIGCAGLRTAGQPAGTAEYGLELDPDHWGRGFAREVLQALIVLGRDDLGLQVLEGRTRSSNARALRLVAQLGFSQVSSVDGEVLVRRLLTPGPRSCARVEADARVPRVVGDVRPEIVSAIAVAAEGHANLSDVVAWTVARRGVSAVVDLITQDEYTSDVVVRYADSVHVVYGVT